MYLLLTDETNVQPGPKRKFFVYGGLIVPLEALETLNHEIQQIRDETGYEPGEVFKFDTNARPDRLEHEEVTEAKRQVIDACLDLDCHFIACVVSHNILKNRSLDEQLLRAANHVIGRFNRFLSWSDDAAGICAVDRLPTKRGFDYLEEKFARGLDLHSGGWTELPRIQLYAATSIGASHANSAMDIVLGTFRYCINAPENEDAAREMLTNVSRLMWGAKVGGTKYVRERGLILRPKLGNIRVSAYRQEYKDLLDHLRELLPEDDDDEAAAAAV